MNIALTKHFEELIARLVASGRYNNSSEVVRAGLPSRKFSHPTSNKQLCFLQHIYGNLRPATASSLGGRAAVVIPDLQRCR